MVSYDSICIGFLLAYLNAVDIPDIDLYKPYLNSLCVDNIWFVGGDECGEDKGLFLLISALCTILNLQVSCGDYP